jgi:hypothetical protein
MVHELSHVDETKTITHFDVKADDLFVENDVFLEAGLVENIAQTAAVRAGYHYRNLHQEEVPVGYIGGLKKLQITHLPKVGDKITTKVEVVNEVFDITLIQAKSFVGEQLLASCEMKIIIVKK